MCVSYSPPCNVTFVLCWESQSSAILSLSLKFLSLTLTLVDLLISLFGVCGACTDWLFPINGVGPASVLFINRHHLHSFSFSFTCELVSATMTSNESKLQTLSKGIYEWSLLSNRS